VEERVRGRSREGGRAYIDAAAALGRQGQARKSGETPRYPRNGGRYTAKGSGMPVDGRRWRAAGGRCNGGRFRRPANRVIVY
jgi:hypothetical protein